MKKKKINVFDEDFDDLLNEASEIEGTSKNVPSKEVEAKNKDLIFYDIKSSDSELKKSVKNFINSQEVDLQFLYDKIGQTNGYNLYYRFDNKEQLGLPSIEKWAALLGYVPYIAFRPQTPAEKAASEEAFKLEKEESLKKKKSRK